MLKFDIFDVEEIVWPVIGINITIAWHMIKQRHSFIITLAFYLIILNMLN